MGDALEAQDSPLNLTSREEDVLRYLANGYHRAEIAEILEIKLPTVHQRIYTAQTKAGARTTIQLIALFVLEKAREWTEAQ